MENGPKNSGHTKYCILLFSVHTHVSSHEDTTVATLEAHHRNAAGVRFSNWLLHESAAGLGQDSQAYASAELLKPRYSPLCSRKSRPLTFAPPP
jgi:hypothetical protein